MLFERRAHSGVNSIVVGDIGQGHAAYFHGKNRPNRDDIHRRILHDFLG
jgi:hypothetical protein